jgi:hypothetical protein
MCATWYQVLYWYHRYPRWRGTSGFFLWAGRDSVWYSVSLQDTSKHDLYEYFLIDKHMHIMMVIYLLIEKRTRRFPLELLCLFHNAINVGDIRDGKLGTIFLATSFTVRTFGCRSNPGHAVNIDALWSRRHYQESI